MADVKWIKLDTGIFDNRKIKQIEKLPDGDCVLVIWLKILTLAGITNDNGAIYFTKDIPYTEDMLASEFGRPLQTVQMALKVFEKFGMIQVIDNIISVSNWEKYQNVQGLEKVREQTRNRVQKYRDSKRIECNVTCNATVTDGNATDIEEDIEEELDIEKEEEIDKKKNRESRKSKRFSPPTIDEIKERCCEMNYPVKVAEPFYHYYNSKNWYVGRTKMSDWHSALAGWVSREKEFNNSRKGQVDSVSAVDSWI